MDYELVLKVKNAPLLNMMRRSGYNTAAELSRASGMSQCTIGDYLNLKTPAYKKDGFSIRDPVLRLSEFLNASPQEIFPEDHLIDPLKKNLFTAQVEANQLEQLSGMAAHSPEQFLEYMETETRDPFDEMVSQSGLSDRYKRVLTCRLKENMTLSEIAEELGVTRERIRQMEAYALKSLRKVGGKVKLSAGIYADKLCDQSS